MAEPAKAYYVERIARTTTLILVHANTPREAKARSATHGVAMGSETEAAHGFGRVYRAESWDGRRLPQ
jgi:hypothetical protein